MKKVFICSPYRGDIEKNLDFAYQQCQVAVMMGFIPIAPHAYFPKFLDDNVEAERKLGIELGLELMEECSEVWAYGEPTEGMKLELIKAEVLGLPIKFHDEKGWIIS